MGDNSSNMPRFVAALFLLLTLVASLPASNRLQETTVPEEMTETFSSASKPTWSKWQWTNYNNANQTTVKCSRTYGETGSSNGLYNEPLDLTPEHTCAQALPRCVGYRQGYWGP